MAEKKTLKYLMFVAAVAALFFVAIYYYNLEKSSCIGLPFITEEEMLKLGEYRREDLSGDIYFMDTPAAVDRNNNAIYIPQKFDNSTLYSEIDGTLNLNKAGGAKLYFLNSGFDDFITSVQNGHYFTVVADLGDGYTKYDLVFTNLPVIRIEGEKSGVNADGRDVSSGTLAMWNPEHPMTGKYTVYQSNLEWNQRGGSTWYDPKKMYKINLKDKDGLNNDLDLAGIGKADDDWLLNAMYKDDSKVKEKLAIELWNSICSETEYNYKMSDGEYAELVMNGEYLGLYFLQSRVDGKYLGLSEDDVLLKGAKGDHQSLETFGAVKQSKYSDDIIWQAVEGVSTFNDVSNFRLENWIDINLLTDLGMMQDSIRQYNNYYIVKDVEGDPQVYITLWDTDFSFGMHWEREWNFQPEAAYNHRKYRNDYEAMAEMYPGLDKQLAQRWFELRETVYSQENINSVIMENHLKIHFCNAYTRDKELWGNYHWGLDNVETLQVFVANRLDFLDSEHSKHLN